MGETRRWLGLLIQKMLKLTLILSIILFSSCESFTEPMDGGPCEYQDFDDEFSAIYDGERYFKCNSLNGGNIELYLTKGEMFLHMNDSLNNIDTIQLIIKGSQIESGSCSPEFIERIRKK